MKLADPDVISPSNLNRIRFDFTKVGKNKCDLITELIYQTNPYAEVYSYSEGITDDNMAEFLDGLDVVVELMDNPELKIKIRLEARKRGMPVLMATDNGDNGLVDIERYDLDPKIQFFHGRMGDVSYEKLVGLDKMSIGRLIIQHIGIETVTNRVRESMPEIGKSLVSWPQLGGAALLNGSAVAYAVRKILNDQPVEENRALISLDEKLIPNYNSPEEKKERCESVVKFKKIFGL